MQQRTLGSFRALNAEGQNDVHVQVFWRVVSLNEPRFLWKQTHRAIQKD
jgi:hypothetical protein